MLRLFSSSRHQSSRSGRLERRWYRALGSGWALSVLVHCLLFVVIGLSAGGGEGRSGEGAEPSPTPRTSSELQVLHVRPVPTRPLEAPARPVRRGRGSIEVVPSEARVRGVRGDNAAWRNETAAGAPDPGTLVARAEETSPGEEPTDTLVWQLYPPRSCPVVDILLLGRIARRSVAEGTSDRWHVAVARLEARCGPMPDRLGPSPEAFLRQWGGRAGSGDR